MLFILQTTAWEEIADGVDLVLETNAAVDSTGQPLSGEPYRLVVPIKP